MRAGAKRSRRKIDPYYDLSDLEGIHKDRRCFVCGAGPSIAYLDLKKIHYHPVIAVNSAALLMPWDDGDRDGRYWISNDSLCLRWDYFWSHVARSQCNKIVRSSWKKSHDKIERYGFRYFVPRQSENDPLCDSDPGLCSVSSIPTAIDISIRMGCRKIYLLGVDQDKVHDVSHFWQLWEKSKWPQRGDKEKNFRPPFPQQEKVFERNKPVFEALKKYAETKGAEIFNCSTRSKLDVFQYASLDEAMK